MFLHNKKLQHTVHVDAPNPAFAKMCLERFGGKDGELGAAMRYFTQGRAESDPVVKETSRAKKGEIEGSLPVA